MAANTTISCNWPSARAAVGDIHADDLDVTDVVAQCANVCELCYESKGAEILGPGIMFSAFVQAVVVCSFGISLPVIIWLLNKRTRSGVAPISHLLRKTQELALETNGFLTMLFFATAICTCIKASNPSIIQFTFISRLIDGQNGYILGLLLSQSADSSLNGTEVSGSWLAYYYTLLAAQYATSGLIKMPNHSVYKTVSKECYKQYHFDDLFSSVSTSGEATKSAGIGIGLGVGIFILFALGFIYHESMPPFLAKTWKMIGKLVPSWLKRHARVISNVTLVAMYPLIIPLKVYNLNALRTSIIQRSRAHPTQESNWGYGQRTAILVWLPFFFSAAKATIKHMRYPPASETENDSLEQRSSPPPPTADAKPPVYDFDFPLPATVASENSENSTQTIDFATDGVRRTSSGLRAGFEHDGA